MATEFASAVGSPARPASSTGAAKTQPTETVIENRIFVGGIPSHANESELRTFLTEKFSKAEIKDIKIISDRTGVSKGYGFVTFETRDMAQAILNSPEYGNMIFKDRKLNISKAVKKLSTKSEHGGGGGAGGGSAAATAATAAILTDSGHVQYLLYRRPDPVHGVGSSGGQQLLTLPFGYCAAPIYLGAANQQMPIFSTVSAAAAPHAAAAAAAALQWPPTVESAATQLIGGAVPISQAGIGQGGELIYYSLPAAYGGLLAASAASATTSDYGTGSAEPTCSSLATDPGSESVEGSPIKQQQQQQQRDDIVGGGGGVGCCGCCCRDRHRSQGSPISFAGFGLQHQPSMKHQLQPQHQNQQSTAAADYADLLLGSQGIIGQFGDLRQDFKFLDHRV